MPSKRMVSMARGVWFSLAPLPGEGWGGGARRWIIDRREPPSLPPPGGRRSLLRLLLRLARILHVLEDVELHVEQRVALLLHLAQVHVLHHVARLRVDEHRAARAFEDLALHG